jgi:hypothetical protein
MEHMGMVLIGFGFEYRPHSKIPKVRKTCVSPPFSLHRRETAAAEEWCCFHVGKGPQGSIAMCDDGWFSCKFILGLWQPVHQIKRGWCHEL